jgi:hypothetical protein
MRKTVPGEMNKRFYGRTLAVTVAGLFAIALVAPASSSANGLLKPSTHHVRCPTLDVIGSSAICSPDPVFWTNTSDFNIVITSIAFSGNNPTDFSFSGTCYVGQTIVPNGSCSLRVGFDPNDAGRRSASLNVVDNTSGDATPVHVAGRGVF